MFVVAVEIDAVDVFAGATEKAGGIEQRTKEPIGAGVENAGFEHVEERERSGGFVAVNAGGKVEARARAGRAFGEREEGNAGDGAEMIDAEFGGASSVFETANEVGGGEGRINRGSHRARDRESCS